MEKFIDILFEDGKVIINKEDAKPILKKLGELELIKLYHYVLVVLPGDRFLIELDPEAMEEYLNERGSN